MTQARFEVRLLMQMPWRRSTLHVRSLIRSLLAELYCNIWALGLLDFRALFPIGVFLGFMVYFGLLGLWVSWISAHLGCTPTFSWILILLSLNKMLLLPIKKNP